MFEIDNDSAFGRSTAARNKLAAPDFDQRNADNGAVRTTPGDQWLARKCPKKDLVMISVLVWALSSLQPSHQLRAFANHSDIFSALSSSHGARFHQRR